MPAWLIPVINFLSAYAPWIIGIVSPLLLLKYHQLKKDGKDAVEKLNAPRFVKDLLESLDSIIEPVIKVIYVDYVEGMKKANADGKLTAEEIAAVNAAAIAKFLELAPKQLMDVLKKIYTPEKISGIVLDLIKSKVQTLNDVNKVASAKKDAVLTAQGTKSVESNKLFAPPDKGFLE